MKRFKINIGRLREHRAVVMIGKCLRNKYLRYCLGLPLLYAGVLILIAHYLLHNGELWAEPICTQPCNWLLVTALVLEIVGATNYFMLTNKRFIQNLLLPIILIALAVIGIIVYYNHVIEA